MPNYRLTHKLTGTCSPDVTGYYGAHEQSTTKWKRAGGGFYQWKSDDIPNTYLIGAAVEADAFKVLTVSGYTDAAFNGSYTYSLTDLKWKKGTTHWIIKSGSVWNLSDGVSTLTAANNSLNIPPATFTLAGNNATVSSGSAAVFASTVLNGTWVALGASTGAPVYSEYTIAEAWYTAETTVFNSLKAWLNGTEDKDCFRGYLPINEEGKYKFASVWMLNSGGNAGAFDIERTYGENGAWCNALINAELVGEFENRTTAMHFAGAVEAWLKTTGNLSQTGNVNWCHLRALPAAPEEQVIGAKRYWLMRIPLEMLYVSESVYA